MGPQETDELLLNTLARLQDEARREHDAAWMERELLLLQSENRLLKDKERVDIQLAALEAKIDRGQPLEERLAALRIENQLLKKRTLLEEELEGLAQKMAQLQIDRTNSKPVLRFEAPERRRRAKSTLNQEELLAVRSAENTFDAAMKYVEAGKATLIEFSADEVQATCGDTRWAVNSDLDVCQRILEDPKRYWRCPVLHVDEPDALAFPPHKARLIIAVTDESIDGLNKIEEVLGHF